MGKEVIIVGGGVAGMQAALSLRERGAEPVIIEKEERLGGKLTGWHRLFPTFTPAEDVLGPLLRRVEEAGIRVMTGTEVEELVPGGVTVGGGRRITGDATVICSGFELFDARLKEEYGYGIYDNVFTTVDIERMLNEGRVATAQGQAYRLSALRGFARRKGGGTPLLAGVLHHGCETGHRNERAVPLCGGVQFLYGYSHVRAGL